MRSFTSLLRRNDGTSLAEFALAAPFLFLVLMGAIEIGRWATFNVTVANAARAGAAYGAQESRTPSDVSGIESAVCTDAHNSNCPTPAPTATNALAVTAPFTNASGGPQFYYCTNASAIGSTPDPSASPDPTCASPAADVQQNRWVRVTVTGTFTPLFSFPGLPSQLPVSSTAIMQVKQ